jgi:hypothetical protein
LYKKENPTKQELSKILINIKDKNIAKFEPSFEPVIGFSYKDIEYYSFEEQKHFFETLEKIGIAASEPSHSILKCSSCDSTGFSVMFTCTLCGSPKIFMGVAIEHDLCGNVDFEHQYKTLDGALKCEKCNRNLKAIGIDYSKKGHYYKCLECKAMLPNVLQQYICLECGKYSTKDELQFLPLYTYTVNPRKLSELLNANNYMLSVAEHLERIGIKSSSLGSLRGKSNIQHTFALVVYDERNTPIIIADTIESADHRIDETFVLAFIARCLDVNVTNRVLIAIPRLEENLKALVYAHGIIVLEPNTRDEAEIDLIQYISRSSTMLLR